MLLQQYQEQWAEDFRFLKQIFSEIFTTTPVTIEHVGSTAVPGLAAKPIIDMHLVYAEEFQFNHIKQKLEQAGYYHNGNQGINGREVFKRKPGVPYHNGLDTIAHHLYVCHKDYEELQRHLFFRDYLLTHDAAKTAYQELKYSIAAEAGQDRKQYAQLKETRAKEFIEDILKKAKQNL